MNGNAFGLTFEAEEGETVQKVSVELSLKR
jgi:hypothetical protein